MAEKSRWYVYRTCTPYGWGAWRVVDTRNRLRRVQFRYWYQAYGYAYERAYRWTR